jgi:hypothetical protein
VDHLAGHAALTGSTTLAELRRFGMGEKLGHLYADPSRRLEIEAHSYRGAVIVGVQPARAGVILDAADAGTPQRFYWTPSRDPDPPKVEPDRPAPLLWVPPRKLPAPEPRTGRQPIAVCQSAVDAIRQGQRDRNAGKLGALDGHALLTRERIAAALGMLTGHYGITEEDWKLAGAAMAVSDATRARVVAALEARKRQANITRGQAEAERAVIVAGWVEQDATKRVARLIRRKLPDRGWITHSDLRKKITSRDRGYFDAAIDVLADAGQINVDETEHGIRYWLPDEAS